MAAVIAGVGSGAAAGLPPHTTFDGRLLAIVRPTVAGPIGFTVSADGVADIAVELDVAGHPAMAGVRS